jgi:ATP-dependent RNA helicase MSS116
LAFLIPVLQNIITKDPSLEKQQRPFRRSTPPDIRAIIISPTRELAEQIAVEAQRVVRNTGVIVQTAVGGMNKAHGMRKIKTEGCHILVGTPGRLEDILQDPYSCIETPKLSAFVLDEADRLLDDGFAQDIQNILRLLPERSAVDRQSLMFSATMPKEVMQMVRSIMKPSYKFVQTVQPGEADTHLKVPQKLVQVAGLENLMPVLLELCKRELANKDAETPFKAIVFFGATSEAKLAKSVFQNLVSSDDRFAPHLLHPMALIEMHAKLGQQQRTRNAETFRQCKTGIMFSSDVSARGMDFPNVSHVIQIGLPSTRDVYVHRLGRTGRRGRTGQGWLLLTAPEMREASHRLPNLPLAVDNTLKTAAIDMTQDADLPASVAETLNQVVKATRRIPEEFKAAAYKATLGIYSWMPSKQGLINLMNNRSKYGWGLATPPNLSAAVVQKLGLRSLEGVNVGPTLYEGKFKPESGHDRDALGQGNSRGYRPGGRFQSGHHGGRGGSPGGYSGGRGGYAGGYSGGPGGSPGGYAGSRGGSSGGYSGGREFGDRRGSGDRGGDGQGRSYGNRGGEAARNFLG